MAISERLFFFLLKTFNSNKNIVILKCGLFFSKYYKEKCIVSGDRLGNTSQMVICGFTIPESDLKLRIYRIFLIGDLTHLFLLSRMCCRNTSQMVICGFTIPESDLKSRIYPTTSETNPIKNTVYDFLIYQDIFLCFLFCLQDIQQVVIWFDGTHVSLYIHLLTTICKENDLVDNKFRQAAKSIHLTLFDTAFPINVVARCLLPNFQQNPCIFTLVVTKNVKVILMVIFWLQFSNNFRILNFKGFWAWEGCVTYSVAIIIVLQSFIVDNMNHIFILFLLFLQMETYQRVWCQLNRHLYDANLLGQTVKSHICYKLVMTSLVVGVIVASVGKVMVMCFVSMMWELVVMLMMITSVFFFMTQSLQAWLDTHVLDTPCKGIPQITCRLMSLLPGPLHDQCSSLQLGHSGSSSITEILELSSLFLGVPSLAWFKSLRVYPLATEVLLDSAAPIISLKLFILIKKVQQMFPDVSYSVILEDLRHTHSVEETVDNILEARILTQPPMFDSSESSSSYFKNDKEEDRISASDGSNYDEKDALLKDSNISPLLPDSEDKSDSDFDGIIGGNTGTGGRFSKSAEERERILEDRKNSLLSAARRRFVARQGANPQSFEDDSNQS
ncbi:unnamed protein product [Meganyctiphanes norvegica]|uniref:CUE domain-containing protein n=1 Tax=Meganyctiphanes norvegica TaxID=48144 RepID=A0AAV2R8G1_MEGNR